MLKSAQANDQQRWWEREEGEREGERRGKRGAREAAQDTARGPAAVENENDLKHMESDDDKADMLPQELYSISLFYPSSHLPLSLDLWWSLKLTCHVLVLSLKCCKRFSSCLQLHLILRRIIYNAEQLILLNLEVVVRWFVWTVTCIYILNLEKVN